MNEYRSFCHPPASQHGTGGGTRTRKTTSPRMNDMTGLILAAIAAAFLAGLLVLPITMPGTARLWSEANSPASFGPMTLVTLAISVRT